ncbi:MAG: transglycosylase SLT domain-containing protein [Chitinispirillaceae bacterium]|nr:transglycosylase SLT domain-containing protein [Chitinispirillaceae bacterium]
MKIFTASILLVLLNGVAPAAAASSGESHFAVPAILEKNVEFWKKVYSELSITKGYLHDADYPMVIFKTIPSSQTASVIERERAAIKRSLEVMEEQPESAWTAIEHRYKKMYLEHADSSAITGASGRIRFQRGQKERFIQGLKRSGLFLDTIRAIFRANGIPERIAYLPHVESSFDPTAYSKVGAAGLWQFMRRTARLFGMKVTYTVDERRDPVYSTLAAAKYLTRAYRELGSWALAITSYNHGIGGMKRAVGRTGSRDIGVIIENYSSRSFRFASSNFYSCFLAASDLAENHHRYFPDVTFSKPLRYHDIRLDYYIKPADLCAALDIVPARLAALNPAIRRAVFSRNKQFAKGMVIHLPLEKTRREASAALAALPDSLKKTKPERPKLYRVERGDNLYRIARMFGLTVQDIALENDLTSAGRIRAGQLLRIPGSRAATLAEAAKKSDTAAVQLASLQEKTEKGSRRVEKPRTDKAVSQKAGLLRTSKKAVGKKRPVSALPPVDDSLKALASAPAVSEEEALRKERPQNVSSSFDASVYSLDAVVEKDTASAVITVAVGETMSHYCDWLIAYARNIRKLNGMRRGAPLRVGQRMRIPLDDKTKLDQFTTTRLEYHMAQEEDFYGQYTVYEVTPHLVKRGDNLWSLCNDRDDELPFWLLKKYNKKTDFGKLAVGDTIWMPIVVEKGGG